MGNKTHLINETFTNASDRTGKRITTFNTILATQIGTWNVRTMNGITKLAQLEKEMTKYNVKILGLSEIRWTGSGEITTPKNNTIIYSGPTDNSGERGVGIFIAKQFKNSLIEWNPISDRLIVARFKNKFKNVSFINCYAPTETTIDEEKDEFYEQLTTALMNCPKTDIIVLVGDFNAQVETRKTNCFGVHGIGKTTNNNGQRLMNLCGEFNLVIGGTLFPHKRIHKYTWTSPDRKTTTQIDHICISRKWRSSLQDVRTWRGADIESDHMLLVGKIRLKPIRLQNKSDSRHKKMNIQKLIVPEIRLNLLDKLQETQSISQIRDISEEVLGTKTKQHKPWISTNTWALIEERKNMRLKLLTDPLNNNLTQCHKSICKNIKKSARNDKRAYYNGIADEAEKAAEMNNTRMLYSRIKQLSNRGIKKPHSIRDKVGQIITTREDQLQRWVEYFEDTPGDVRPLANNQQSRVNSKINANPPSLKEIKTAIEKLKNNKAEGIDGVPAEILKTDPDFFSRKLQPAINQIWSTEEVPQTWKSGLLVKLPKKGDLTHCSNWRGITILNCATKILAIILLLRIQEHIDPMLRDEQAGFRASKGCIDNSNTLRQIVEQSVEWNSPLYALFIDFQRAFDALDRRAI